MKIVPAIPPIEDPASCLSKMFRRFLLTSSRIKIELFGAETMADMGRMKAERDPFRAERALHFSRTLRGVTGIF
jgi:hypothetical protein